MQVALHLALGLQKHHTHALQSCLSCPNYCEQPGESATQGINGVLHCKARTEDSHWSLWILAADNNLVNLLGHLKQCT